MSPTLCRMFWMNPRLCKDWSKQEENQQRDRGLSVRPGRVGFCHLTVSVCLAQHFLTVTVPVCRHGVPVSVETSGVRGRSWLASSMWCLDLLCHGPCPQPLSITLVTVSPEVAALS